MQVALAVGIVVMAALLVLSGILLVRRTGRRVRDLSARPPLPALTSEAGRPPSPPAAAGLICPSCRREYPTGLRFCPADARPLMPSGEAAARPLGSGVTCPACKRSFDPQTRFCPFDAEELVPVGMAGGAGARHVPMRVPGLMGKICPNCAQKYETEATFCGRDGSELVSVN